MIAFRDFYPAIIITSKDLWSLVKKSVKSIGCDGGVLVVDDTIEEKCHTNENDIVGWHCDHRKGQNTKDKTQRTLTY